MPLKVAIIGRPNVGKSTLFNRLAGRKLAIVHDKPGVTRDRKETEAKLQDLDLLIIDTAGYEYSNEDNLERRMWEQTKKAIDIADVCLFLYDARDGLQPYDEHFADILRKSHKPVILLANKCEGKFQEDSRFEAYKLGLGEPIPFSAEHGLGMLDLYDALKKHYKEDEEAAEEEEYSKEKPIQLAIVGRPNVGKSTLVNALLQDDRMLTGPEAGVTRDAISLDWEWKGRKIKLVDTAGLRRHALAEAESDETLKNMHQYFASLTPSQQNEYTGYFEGKNLILITAEAFSPYVISEELTPTLYKLSHEGFVFNNYYQPNWTQSTTGGEFAVMTGLIPTWLGNALSFRVSANNSMPTALGWQFGGLGYNTLAYHNNTYTYYGRHETHPNLGYDYRGIGSGLEVSTNLWPNSDLEMIQNTAEEYIRDYVENGINFHAYYMTISGHCNYNWAGNAMARKNRDAAVAAYPNASESVQAYIACNLELEYAMAYLVEQLEAAGIADDTVIVLTADHYPYAMAEGDVDYYNELTGLNDSERLTSRYRNSLIMWCGSMEEPVVVDTPCSSIDIVPTLCNLFGLEYESRLYSGRDVFATNYVVNEYSNCMPLVVFANTGYGNSWITAAGTYEADTRTFTPNPGVEVSDGYVAAVSRLVQNKYSYAKLIVQTDYYGKVFDR